MNSRRTIGSNLIAVAVLSVLGASCQMTNQPTYIYRIVPDRAKTNAVELGLTFDDSVGKRPSPFSSMQHLLMFRVDIKNLTDRVIHTAGWKVVFGYQGQAYDAMTKAEILTWMKDTPAPSQQAITAVAGKKLFNELMEILPGYAQSTFVCFPVDADISVDGKIDMFDVPDGVDAAGNVTSKKNLTFQVTRTSFSQGTTSR